MNDKNKQLIRTIVLWSLFGLLIVGTILVFVFDKQINDGPMKLIDETDPMSGKEPAWLSVFHIETDNGFLKWLVETAVPGLLNTIRIAGIAIALAIGVHYLAKLVFQGKKAKTIARLMVSFLKWVIFLCSIFFILDAWGANTTTMLASAGVLTLIIGLGAQSLIADILAGIFIVFEGEFQVGDIVIIDSWRGEVKEIGMRTTKLVDAGGNIKIVNNSEIRTIINQTQELSVAKTYVSISYGARIEKVEAVIADNIGKMKEKIPAIVEGPYYKGVSELGESGVVLLFIAKCKEDDYYQVGRDLNREVKIMFDDNGIEIPFNQVVIHQEDGTEDKDPKPTKKEIKKAEDFNDQQKELSDDIVQ